MAHRRNRIASALLPLALVLAPLAGVAWGDGGAPAHGKKKADAAFASACSQANAKYASRDFDAAIDLYRKATEMSPHQAMGYYLLGEAQLAAGKLDDAEASWTRAAAETDEKDPSMRARVLFVSADLKEREKKWEDAKAAWQVYLDWAQRYPNATVFPATAHSRQQAMDTMIKQDRADQIVRERIAATADGGVFSDPSKPPPAK